MDKLLHTILYRSLFFCSLETLKDVWEGAYDRHYLKLSQIVSAAMKGDEPIDDKDEQDKIQKDYRMRTCINCWHLNEYESAAMWSLYSGTNGIAIVSTVDRLVNAISGAPQAISIGQVRYVDFRSGEHQTLQPLSEPAMFKRKSFEHEQEIRAFTTADNASGGIDVPVDLIQLIEVIVISPEAPNWHEPMIKDILKKIGLPLAVEKSDLYRPI